MKERLEAETKKTCDIRRRLYDLVKGMRKSVSEGEHETKICDFSRHFEPVNDRRWGIGAARWG